MKDSLDGLGVEVHYLKRPEYVMTLMSSYGTLKRVSDDKKRVWINEGSCAIIEASIKYHELFFNHFQNKYTADAYKGRRMFPIALEETWKTNRWACRVSVFQFAIS